MADYVAIVTGSRLWGDRLTVWETLDAQAAAAAKAGADRFIVRHGGCPTGADLDAACWCDDHSAEIEVVEDEHEAKWDLYGRAAGAIRNKEMALALPKAHVCLAFSMEWLPTPGTKDMIGHAVKADIPTFIIVAKASDAKAWREASGGRSRLTGL